MRWQMMYNLQCCFHSSQQFSLVCRYRIRVVCQILGFNPYRLLKHSYIKNIMYGSPCTTTDDMKFIIQCAKKNCVIDGTCASYNA